MKFTEETKARLVTLIVQDLNINDMSSSFADGLCSDIQKIINQNVEEQPKYNGWSNRETWTVNNYITQGKAALNYWQSQAMAIYNHAKSDEVPKFTNAKETLAKELKRVLGEIEFNPYSNVLQSDLLQCSLDKVDWEELANDLLNQLKDMRG